MLTTAILSGVGRWKNRQCVDHGHGKNNQLTWRLHVLGWERFSAYCLFVCLSSWSFKLHFCVGQVSHLYQFVIFVLLILLVQLAKLEMLIMLVKLDKLLKWIKFVKFVQLIMLVKLFKLFKLVKLVQFVTFVILIQLVQFEKLVPLYLLETSSSFDITLGSNFRNI